MTGLVLCALAFWFVTRLASRSIGHGVGAVLLVGYTYGITRANVVDNACHFLFDSAVLGLYSARLRQRWSAAAIARSREIMPWFTLLVMWPLLVFLIPQRHFLIQLVGLRAAIFFLPFVMIGARIEREDLDDMAWWMTRLNLLVFVVALGEYFLGIERFFPKNAMTELIYRSTDAGGKFAHRIPATFSGSHSYAGTMVATLPFLLTRWQSAPSRAEKLLVSASMVATALGIFMAAARLPVVLLFGELAFIASRTNVPVKFKMALAVVGTIVSIFVAQSERFQRFLTLRNTEYVADRVSWSVNMSFFDMILAHPFGAGLGSAVGTSVPYFLQSYQTSPPVGMENEYGRITVEQSLVGLAIWLYFIVKTLARTGKAVAPQWMLATQLMKAYIALMWTSAFIGTGTLMSIPQTALMLVQMGIIWQSRPRTAPHPSPAPQLDTPAAHGTPP